MASAGIRIWGEPTPYNAPTRGELMATVNAELVRLGEAIEARAKAAYMTGGAGPGKAAKTLSVRTDMLRSSVAYAVPRAGTLVVGSNMRYAAVHEFGEPEFIRPKKAGGFLTIPTREALTPSGVEKEEAKEQRDLGRARAPSKLFVDEGEKGGLVLRHNETGKVWFTLVKQVRTKARPYLQPAAKDKLPRFEKRLTQLLMPWKFTVARAEP